MSQCVCVCARVSQCVCVCVRARVRAKVMIPIMLTLQGSRGLLPTTTANPSEPRPVCVVMWSMKTLVPSGSNSYSPPGDRSFSFSFFPKGLAARRTPPPRVSRDAWGWSVGSSRGHAHSMRILLPCGEVEGTGPVVCWRQLYMWRLTARQGSPRAGLDRELMVCRSGRK